MTSCGCRFGCDELFERGYIGVAEDGAILLSEALRPGRQPYIYAQNHLAGKNICKPMADREHYFGWHRTHSFRG